ncbi:hypothetical protein RM553_16330 [Zunongwangia sp. F363]|uniref:Uncharacterized protein n=1 Tax=Autumnicola tepida TaxID=3075595 RepID=A0ABU3CDI3_9FLAO|nr:hypothetical protein [Zunongwangia sp. F363]MDT0644407.1 hypothetical protein [Zunongwangia sp. F363]
MEKRSRKEILAKKIMKNAGLEKPSADFSANVLKAVEARQKVLKYEPLISRKTWFGIAGAVIVAVIGLYVISSDLALNIDFSFINALSFPKLNLSSTMMYAVAFISLFFLEIPFLKRFLVKQYD